MFVVLRLHGRLGVGDTPYVEAAHDSDREPEYDGEDIFEQKRYFGTEVVPGILNIIS